jgi:hypothetical protein
MTRLDELDREEWWDVRRAIKPDADRAEFDEEWLEFQAWKARRESH